MKIKSPSILFPQVLLISLTCLKANKCDTKRQSDKLELSFSFFPIWKNLPLFLLYLSPYCNPLTLALIAIPLSTLALIAIPRPMASGLQTVGHGRAKRVITFLYMENITNFNPACQTRYVTLQVSALDHSSVCFVL